MLSAASGYSVAPPPESFVGWGIWPRRVIPSLDLPADPPAKSTEPVAHRCGLHMAKVEWRLEALEYCMLERLGHSTIAITLDTYSHAIPAMQEEAAAMIADLVSGAE